MQLVEMMKVKHVVIVLHVLLENIQLKFIQTLKGRNKGKTCKKIIQVCEAGKVDTLLYWL